MKSKKLLLVFIAILLSVTFCSHLDTKAKSSLILSQFIVSPMGYYRAHLLANCSIQIQKFNTSSNKYSFASTIDAGKNNNTNCTSLNLSLQTQSVIDSQGKTYFSPSQHSQHYNRFKLKINDVGTLYLLSFYHGPDNQIQYSIDYFSSGNQGKEGRFLYSLQTPVQYTNKNNWRFQNSKGDISVKKNETSFNSVGKFVNLQGYQLRQTGFADPQGQIRYANIPGMPRKPKNGGCTGSEGVFVEFDEYWPIMRVYDEDKYLVAEYTLDEGLKVECPEKTFREAGQCVSKCSAHLYSQIEGDRGQCVLSCQSNFKIQAQSKTCTSPNSNSSNELNMNVILGRKCPTGSKEYAFGCICSNSGFYDFISNICRARCPESTFGYSGLCMKCPSNCKTCQLNPTKASFLTCQSCSEGFSGNGCLISSTSCTNILNCAECTKDKNGQQICNRCSHFYALSVTKKQCSYTCSKDEILIVGSEADGYCFKVPKTGVQSPADYVGGVYNREPYLIRKSGTCGGERILRDTCVSVCPPGTELNSDRRCICSKGMATINNSTCYKIEDIVANQIGLYYNTSLNSFMNCPVGCVSCDYDLCYQCSPAYVLVVSGSSSVCRQNSLHFSCSSTFYTYHPESRICIANNLVKVQSNITNCNTEYKGRCLACKSGYFLSEQQCKSSCGQGFNGSNGMCIKSVPSCQLSELTDAGGKTILDADLLNSPLYQVYSKSRSEISNDPSTQIIAVRDSLGILSPSPTTAILYTPKIVCKIPKSAYIPPPVSPTPNGVITVCTQPTPFRLQNGKCVATCPSDTIPITFGNGPTGECQILTECQKKNKNTMTPFELSNFKCASSCPAGTVPLLQGQSKLKCVTSTTTVAQKMHIDSSVFDIGTDGSDKRKIFFFVVDGMLNLSDIIVSYYKGQKQVVSETKLQQSKTPQKNIEFTQFMDKTYLAISSTADEVVLDLSKNIQQFKGADGKLLASSVYGVNANSNRIHNTHSWLAIIGYVLSLLLIILHSIYIGNQLIYKVDNFLVFAQTLYYFSFVHLLINASIGQFYYGFFWSHFGFFPNYFQPAIPSHYMEGNFRTSKDFLPNSYRLLTGDANFIRNAGFSLSLLLTFICTFAVIVLVIFMVKKVCGKYELWFSRVAKQALLAGIQFLSMNIFYWGVAHLLCNQNSLFEPIDGEPQSHSAYRRFCSITAIVLLGVFGIYMIIRLFYNRIGGLYMFKRLAIATVLAASAYQNNGVDDYRLFALPLAATELIFCLLRFPMEKTTLKRQRVFILLQALIMIGVYVAIYLWNDTGFVSIFVSLLLFLFIFLFTADLMDVYLDNRDEYYDDRVKLMPGLRQKQMLAPNGYEQIANPVSQPESDRRLRSE